MSTPLRAEGASPLLPLLPLPAPTRVAVPLIDIEEADTSGAVNLTRSSIQQIGMTQAVTLEVIPGQPHVVLDGKRRVQNARLLGMETVAADLYPPLTAEQRAHLKISLHLRGPNRADEARTLLDLARAHALPLDHPDTADQLKVLSGLSKGHIRRVLKLANLPADVLALIGTSVSEGVASGVANLQGEHRDQAVQAIRAKAAQDEQFTGQDLKEVQQARGALMGQHLGAVTLPNLLTLTPVQALASDVRMLASERNILLADLILELQQGDQAPLPNPFDALFGHVPTPPAPVPGSATGAPPSWLAAEAAPWDLPGSGETPVSEEPVPTSQAAFEALFQASAALAVPEAPLPPAADPVPVPASPAVLSSGLNLDLLFAAPALNTPALAETTVAAPFIPGAPGVSGRTRPGRR